MGTPACRYLPVEPKTAFISNNPPSQSNATNRGAGVDKIDPYQLLEKIGWGTLTAVYRARTQDGRIVALKLLNPDAARDQRRLLRFYQGAKLAMQLDHANVVRTLEVGAHQGRHFTAMEYAGGGNLARLVMRSGKLDERTALGIIVQVARGLECVHQHGILHRDVNPANILLAAGGRVLLGDLGLSKQLEADLHLTIEGIGLGTLDYIAPEQIRQAKDVGPAADVYGLGTTLYAMLTGKLPFAGKTVREKWLAKVQNACRPPEQFNPAISPGTLRLIRRAMDAEPSRRPAGAREFALAAGECLRALEAPRPAAAAVATLWHLLVADRQGRARLVAGSEDQIARLIAQGRLMPEVLASRGGQEPFVPLAQISRFRAMFPATRPRPGAAPAAADAGRQRARAGLAGIARPVADWLGRLAARIRAAWPRQGLRWPVRKRVCQLGGTP